MDPVAGRNPRVVSTRKPRRLTISHEGIVPRPGDGREPGVNVLEFGVLDARRGHGLGQMCGNTYFVVFIHR